MAFNGSGTFSRIYSWATDKTNAVVVTASRMDTEHDGFATGLSTAICKDGQTTTTAVIPFAAGIKASDGSLAAPSVSFISDTDSGIFRSAANTLSLVVAGTQVMEVGTATISCAAAISLTTPLTVANGGTGIATTNSARVNNSANISIPNNTNTVLTFDTEDTDTNTLHSVALNTSRLTAIVAGTYVISGSVSLEAGAGTTTRTVAIKKNGLTYLAKVGRVIPSTANELFTVTAIAQLAATDYVELEVYQNSGGSINALFSAGVSPIFAMARVSA